MKKWYFPTNSGVILGWIAVTMLLGIVVSPTVFGADRIVLAEHFSQIG